MYIIYILFMINIVFLTFNLNLNPEFAILLCLIIIFYYLYRMSKIYIQFIFFNISYIIFINFYNLIKLNLNFHCKFLNFIKYFFNKFYFLDIIKFINIYKFYNFSLWNYLYYNSWIFRLLNFFFITNIQLLNLIILQGINKNIIYFIYNDINIFLSLGLLFSNFMTKYYYVS